ncbi:galactose-1-phosphate uridylyltransferase, partial [Pseudonaja textilis]|uniref:galactose-1-phosphate uridylyltransferase n=1 Tax=Pseudonaja textilis TaxID=8673 RepID=UPI000EA9BD95
TWFSSRHPNSLSPPLQIWASDFLPNEASLEDQSQRKYHRDKSVPMLLDYARLEAERKERVVVENADWLVVVPYWAVWPFQTLLLPRRHVCRLEELRESERDSKGVPFGDDGERRALG